MRQLAKSFEFTLMELLLALVVLMVGFQGFVSLFSASVDSSRAAIGQTNSTDAVQQFLYLISGKIKDNWDWINAFPKEKSEINDTWVGWSDNPIMNSNGVKIDFMSDMAARTVDDMVNTSSVN
jgi:Tfp pilus assembly protein PilV